MPLIVGALLLVLLVTVIENAGSDAVALPSLTLMMMFWYVPTLAAVARFDSRPVLVLKTSHAGLLRIENLSSSPSASEAFVQKLYQLPAFTVVGGVPEMLGV